MLLYLMMIIPSLITLIFMFLVIKSLKTSINIDRFERRQELKNPKPTTSLIQLNLLEPAITFSTLVLCFFIPNKPGSLSSYNLPFFNLAFIVPLPLPIISLLSMIGLLVLLPLGWSFSRNRTTRRVSHRLI